MIRVITILDTNVVSEPMRPSPSPALLAWLSEGDERGPLFVTTITVAEILFGIELLPSGKRRDEMLAQAEAAFAEDFAGRVLPFDEDAARAFPEIAVRRRAQGRPIADLMPRSRPSPTPAALFLPRATLPISKAAASG